MNNKFMTISIGILLFGFMAFVGGRLPGFLFFTYVTCIALTAFHGYYGQKKLSGSIELPEEDLIAGETIELTTTFINEGNITFPRLEYTSNLYELLSGHASLTKQFHLDGGSKFTDTVKITCKRRGLYKHSHTDLHIKDIFNLFTFKKELKAPIHVKIYPRIIPLDNLTVESGLPLGDIIIDDPICQDYTAIDTLRTYREGDPVKKIHWRASAKHENLIVKEYDFRGDAEILLLLNASLNDYKDDPHRLIEDRLVETAVSITQFCLNRQLNTSYIENRDGFLTLTNGDRDGFMKLFLERYMVFQPLETTEFYKSIQKMSPSIKQGTTIIIITPTIDKNLATTIVDLKMKNTRPMVFLINHHLPTSKAYEFQMTLMRKLVLEGITTSNIGL